MAITQTLCTSFKSELLGGVHDLDTDTLKMALIIPSMAGTYGAATTNYSDVTGNSDEVSATGTNYTTGGVTITSPAITTDGTTAIFDCADVVFSNVDLDARGAIIYNSSKSNAAICLLDFGETKTATDGDFTVVMPAAAAATAIIRIA
jgi:hypothetical protein